VVGVHPNPNPNPKDDSCLRSPSVPSLLLLVARKPIMAQPPGIIKHIEAQTHRLVTIETKWTAQTFAKCHGQDQWMLYRLPQEIRDMTFAYATVPCNIPKYGDRCSRVNSSTALLATCRRAWLETKRLPLSQVVFWLHDIYHSLAEEDFFEERALRGRANEVLYVRAEHCSSQAKISQADSRSTIVTTSITCTSTLTYTATYLPLVPGTILAPLAHFQRC